MAKVEIKLDLAKLSGISRAAQDAALEAVGALRDAVVSARVVPFDNGSLQNSMGVPQEVQGDEIHTMLCAGNGDVPYAKRLYYHPEYDFQKGNNENAQGEWLKPWLPGGEQEGFLQDAFVQRMKARMPK